MLCEHKGPGDHEAGDCCVRALTLCPHQPRGAFETDVRVAKSTEGNA